MFQKKFNYPLINFTVFLFLLFLGISNIQLAVKFFLKILSILEPFLLGFLLSYAVYPVVSWLEKKFSKVLAIVLVLLILLGLFCFLIFSVFPLLYHQVASFSIQLVQVFGNLQDKFSFLSIDVRELLLNLSSEFIQSVGKITFFTTVDLFSSLLQFLNQFLLVFVIFILSLLYMENIRSFFKNLLLLRNFKVYSFLQELDKNMVCYLKSLGLFMFVQFVEYSVLFFLIGHPYWLVLGVLIGVFTVIPFLGGICSNLLSFLSAFMVSPTLFYCTLIVVFTFSLFDEYILSPKIYGKKNAIHPGLTIFLLSLGGSVAGIWGIILSLPTYLFFRTVYLFFKEDTKKTVRFIRDTFS